MENGTLILIIMISMGIIGVGVLFVTTPSAPQEVELKQEPSGPAQIVEITATARGYEPSVVRVKVGMPVELRVTADKNAGCSRSFVMPDFNVRMIAESGKVKTARFVPEAGEYVYRCSMNMYRGKLIAE